MGSLEPMLPTGSTHPPICDPTHPTPLQHLHHHASLLKSSIKQVACVGAWGTSTMLSTAPAEPAEVPDPERVNLEYLSAMRSNAQTLTDQCCSFLTRVWDRVRWPVQRLKKKAKCRITP